MRRIVRGATALLAVAVWGLSRSPSTAAADATAVDIANFTFKPAMVTVPLGATVVWTNHDDDPHSVVATDHAFRAPVLDTGDSFRFTFVQPGRYEYFCSLHPHMVGVVVVAGH